MPAQSFTTLLQSPARLPIVRPNLPSRTYGEQSLYRNRFSDATLSESLQRRSSHLAHFSKDRVDAVDPTVKASKIPDFLEDREVMHNAYMHAFTEAQPEKVQLPGMQEFAAGILSRTRIPSQAYTDPLGHIFQEFDKDGDGSLKPAELAAALRSRNVVITDEQAEMFIDVVDITHTHKISQADFRELVLHMAAADLHSRRQEHNSDDDGAWVSCTWEEDEEIQVKLKSWMDKVMSLRKKT